MDDSRSEEERNVDRGTTRAGVEVGTMKLLVRAARVNRFDSVEGGERESGEGGREEAESERTA